MWVRRESCRVDDWLPAEDEVDRHRQAGEQSERGDELHLPFGAPEEAEQDTVEREADQRSHHDDCDERGRDDSPVLVRTQLVVDDGREKRLHPECEVEDARRLVCQDEPDGDEPVHAPERYALDQIAQRVV